MSHSNDSKLYLRVVDPRTVRLVDTRFLEEHDESDEIIRLYKQRSKVEITIGSMVYVKNAPHRVNMIVRGMSGGKIVCYDLKSASRNTSSVFVTPLLGYRKEELLFDTNLINAFMSTIEHDRCIALLYRFSGEKSFLQFESWVKSQPDFMAHYDPDNYHALYVFSVPKIANSTYDLIRNGKYSEIDDLWKLVILGFHGYDRDGKTGQILYKDPRLKKELEAVWGVDLGDNELHSIPYMDKERFDPQYYLTKKRDEQTRPQNNTGETDDSVSDVEGTDVGGTTPTA